MDHMQRRAIADSRESSHTFEARSAKITEIPLGIRSVSN